MGETKAEKVYAVIVVLIFFIMLGSIVVYYFQKHEVGEGVVNHEESAETAVEINWRDLYPFEDVQMDESNSGKSFDSSYHYPRLIRTYLKLVEDLKGRIDSYTTHKIIGRTQMILMANNIKREFLWPEMSVDVIKMKNGYLTYQEQLVTEEDIVEIADSINEFKEYLSERDIGFSYINAGSKVNPNDRQLREVDRLVEYSNENGDHLIQALQERGVDIVDYRDEMHAAGLDWYGAYYRADHHWTNRTQLWAAGVLADKLNSGYGYQFDMSYFDIDNYSVSVYEKRFLGGQGNAVADLSYLEDYELIVPKFETDFSLQVPTRGMDVRGKYEDTLVDIGLLENIEDYRKEDFFDKAGAYEIANIRNDANNIIINRRKNNNDRKKILIFQDSFGWYLCGYLAMDISEIDIIHPMAFDGSIRSYIEQTKPDTVIMLYCERNIRPIDRSTHKSAFDLR